MFIWSVHENHFLTYTYIVLMTMVQVVTQYDSFDEYLKVVDAFMDIILQNQMVSLSGCKIL